MYAIVPENLNELFTRRKTATWHYRLSANTLYPGIESYHPGLTCHEQQLHKARHNFLIPVYGVRSLKATFDSNEDYRFLFCRIK